MVIAILGALSALVFGSLCRAKAKARQAVCMGNLRQVNASVRMYADDSRDALPSTSPSPPDFTAYLGLLRNGGTASASPGNDKVYACPADTFHYDIPTMARAYRIATPVHKMPGMNGTSYAFNAGNFPYGPAHSPRWPGIGGWKSGSVRDPSRTLLVFEYPALIPYSWHRPAAKPGHHNNAECVVSYVDGHVAYTRMYWDEANAKGDHLEAWQYDPPPEYAYRWSGE